VIGTLLYMLKAIRHSPVEPEPRRHVCCYSEVSSMRQIFPIDFFSAYSSASFGITTSNTLTPSESISYLGTFLPHGVCHAKKPASLTRGISVYQGFIMVVYAFELHHSFWVGRRTRATPNHKLGVTKVNPFPRFRSWTRKLFFTASPRTPVATTYAV
jgi:hypothetical protein